MVSEDEEIGSRPQRRRRHLTDVQSHALAAVGEFAGTFLFLWLAYAGHLMASDHAYPPPPAPGFMSSQTVVFVAISYGFSLLINGWAFYRVSGGLFNPAVGLGSSTFSTW